VTLIIDASVALKWVLDEPEHEAALALMTEGGLAAPDFLLVECANVLAMKTRAGASTAKAAAESFKVIKTARVRWEPARPHLPAAMTIAEDLRQSAYDSLYLALAMAENAVLVTADGRFARAALASPAHAPHIRLL